MAIPKRNKDILEKLKEKMVVWQKSPLLFIDDMWNLVPQPVKPEYQTAVSLLIEQNELMDIRPEWFEPFQRGVHLTWQQWLIFLAVEKAVNNQASKRISIASGHGIGKSCTMSMLLIWYLFTHHLAQVACTAPTSKQLFDVLWKEVAIWISRLPQGWKNKFEWQSTYIRMTDAPEAWFASAKTAKKDSTEALAGVHGQHVAILTDEASGVPTEVFNTMEGSLTEEDILVILISNPTRLSGYFFDTHHKMKHRWQTLQFSNIDSPLPKDDYAQGIIEQHGLNSDEYRIRVLGQFPNEDAIDDSGYVPLLARDEIREVDKQAHTNFVGTTIMGIDPAGEGRDETIWVVRDQFKAMIVAREKVSSPISIANKTRTLAHIYKVLPSNVWIDSFGVGSNVAAEIAKDNFRINALNVGDACEKEKDRELYLNRRAQVFFRVQKAIRSGFELVRDRSWREDLSMIRFRRNERNRIQIMSKKEMRKEFGKSPDVADALALTFAREQGAPEVRTFLRSERESSCASINPTITRNTHNNIHSAI